MSDDAASALLSYFIQLEKECRHAESLKELGFIITNRTKKLIPFKQAYFWKKNRNNKIKIITASSTASVNDESPFIIWLKDFIHLHCDHLTQSSTINTNNAEYIAAKALHVPIHVEENDVTAGLLFSNDSAWDKNQVSVMELLSDEINASLEKLAPTKLFFWHRFSRQRRIQIMVAGLFAFIGLMFIPTHLTIVADAAVVAKDPTVIASPLNGAVEKIDVTPNQEVKKGQVLLNLDPTELKTEVKIAKQNLAATKEKLRKTFQAAFDNDESKMQLAILKIDTKKAKTQLIYSESLLKRSVVRAPISGVVIFSDKNEWLGKPVKIGERIMLVANPDQKELEIKVPVSDSVPIKPDAAVRFYLNIDPLTVQTASVLYDSYEATPQDDGSLAYIVKAAFSGKNIPGIGSRGTAKINGPKVTLFYYLFRRPLYALRRVFGV